MFVFFSLKVDVCASVSGVGIPSSVGKNLCTWWSNIDIRSESEFRQSLYRT